MTHYKNINAVSSNTCYGCRACEQICPHNCISFRTNEMGFIIPQITTPSQCINCGLCLKVCPRIQYKEPLNTPSVYAIKHIDPNVRFNSSSGGAFTALSDAILQENGYISGCIFNKATQKVEFIVSNSIYDRDLMRGSKYVQADTLDVYSKIKKLLSSNLVLFVGTPCQCEGLKKFLTKDHPNLLLVDILCHSVPSPLILSESLKQCNPPIMQITMRDKINGWRNCTHVKIINYQNNEVIDNTFLNLFYKGLISRPSCSTCQFTKTNRCTDITIGDFWKIDKVKPEFEDQLGISLMIINTPKGEKWFKKISSNINYIKSDINNCIQFCMQHPTYPSSKKKKFWKDFQKYGYNYCVEKYGHYTIKEKLISGPIAYCARKTGLSTIIRKLRNH